MIKIGLIGSDTTHATAFTSLLNDEKHSDHFGGAVVKSFLPYYSPELNLSISRHQKIEKKLVDEYGLRKSLSIEELASHCDAFLLLTLNPSRKKEWFRELSDYQKPVFIDKPLCLSSDEAVEIRAISRESGTPFMSCSALRFETDFIQLVQESKERPSSVSISGPLLFEGSIPGYFWYGIHMIEMLVTIQKEMPSSITLSFHEGRGEYIDFVWPDGRKAKVCGYLNGDLPFSVTLTSGEHTRSATLGQRNEPIYKGLLKEVVSFFRTGIPPVPFEQTVTSIKILEWLSKHSKASRI
ncbi:Gfo/Idh/MocA family oxidoreductase [Mesobacillus foraminis]|uniref:Gfo/Idh/MocA family oxidoreductase n=1 Tax=Mesobacillus foraminis TaxID=279826 RepID=UPI001BE4E293|nr:Gfo/Idh/MocA family oxidoreductase [Mesobacillus foraminis]MBT2758039.1 Gfo/Idh/MocA family oxidoreductase [Mesobacillus foraminis]